MCGPSASVIVAAAGTDPLMARRRHTPEKRLRELEVENARLKKLLAEAELDRSMLKELAEGNF